MNICRKVVNFYLFIMLKFTLKTLTLYIYASKSIEVSAPTVKTSYKKHK